VHTSAGPASFADATAPQQPQTPYALSSTEGPTGLWAFHALVLMALCAVPLGLVVMAAAGGQVEGEDLSSASFAGWAWALVLWFYVGGAAAAGWAALQWKRELRPDDAPKSLFAEWAPNFSTVALLAVGFAAIAFVVEFALEQMLADTFIATLVYQFVSSTGWMVVLFTAMVSACDDVGGRDLWRTLGERLRRTRWAFPRLVLSMVARIFLVFGVLGVLVAKGPFMSELIAVVVAMVCFVVGHRWLHMRLFLLYVHTHDEALEAESTVS